MPTEREIKDSYKQIHDDFSASYYSGKSGLSKADFENLHRQVWEDMEAELIAAGYKQPALPTRDYGAEIDVLKEKVKNLEKI